MHMTRTIWLAVNLVSVITFTEKCFPSQLGVANKDVPLSITFRF